MAELIAALKALPQIIGILTTIGKYLKQNFGDNPEKFLLDAHDAFLGLKNAKTAEEKMVAAHSIRKLVERL